MGKIRWNKFGGISKKDSSSINKYNNVTSIVFLHTPIEFPFDFSFFRVRNYADIKNDKIRPEYSYPPACFTTSNLRANLIGNPVFYCSDHSFVALLEYLDKWTDERNYKNETFVISNWKLKKGKRHFIAPYIPETLSHTNEYTTLATFSNDQFRKKAKNNIEDDKINAMRAMKNYLASIFIEDKDRTISSYLGHHNIYNNPVKPPIFMFPSVKADKGENNFALHPNFVDENLQLNHIWKLKIGSIKKNGNEMQFNFKLLNQFGYIENDYIRWTSIKGNEEQIKKQYKLDFKDDLNLNENNYM